LSTVGCERCRKAEEAIGRAEVRAAQAEAGLGRERKWWSLWMAAALLAAGYAAYLQHSYALKDWVWYDLVVPARQARQGTPRQPPGARGQQPLPPAQGAQATPRQPQDGRPAPRQPRGEGQR